MGAREIVEAYHNAWTSGDIDRARTFLADGLDFKGSVDTFDKGDDLASALSEFTQLLERVDLLRSFYSDNEAALLYDCVTKSPAGTIRTAEFFKVQGDKISEIRLVFDATELRKMMGR